MASSVVVSIRVYVDEMVELEQAAGEHKLTVAQEVRRRCGFKPAGGQWSFPCGHPMSAPNRMRGTVQDGPRCRLCWLTAQVEQVQSGGVTA